MQKLPADGDKNFEFIGFADALTLTLIVLFLIISILLVSYSNLFSKELNNSVDGKFQKKEIKRLIVENDSLQKIIDSLSRRDTTLFTFRDDNLGNNEVLFESGSDQITESYQKELDKALTIIKQRLDQNGYIKVVGHTDDVPISSGNLRYKDNWDLGAARAAAVVRYLTNTKSFPVDPTKILVISYGEHHPLNTDTTLAARAQNRRIEILLTREMGSNKK